MFTYIARRMSIGLAAALVVGSLALVDVGTARAQSASPNQAASQTVTPAVYGQPGYGNGYGYPCPWFNGAGYVQAGQPGYRQAAPRYANASGRYYGNHRYSGRSYGYPCW